MIRLYIEEGSSLDKIAQHFKRSSRTPLLHIQGTTEQLEEAVSVQHAEESEAYTKAKSLRKEGNSQDLHFSFLVSIITDNVATIETSRMIAGGNSSACPKGNKLQKPEKHQEIIWKTRKCSSNI